MTILSRLKPYLLSLLLVSITAINPVQAAPEQDTESPEQTEQTNAFVIKSATTKLIEHVYYLNAAIDYNFTPSVIAALHNGVPIRIKLNINISHQRDYLWDETVAHLEQQYQLQYHILTRRYLIKNINSGSLHSFPALDTAKAVLGTLIDFPLLDKTLLKEGERYEGHIQAELNREGLPVPLRLQTLFSDEWQLDSNWYTWPIQP